MVGTLRYVEDNFKKAYRCMCNNFIVPFLIFSILSKDSDVSAADPNDILKNMVGFYKPWKCTHSFVVVCK